jgi:rsbT antagonist protein RsbS
MSEPLLRIPIIKLQRTLIVSIQIALSDRVVQQLKDDVTVRIDEWKAKGLVIDVSGVDVMDSYLTRSIRDIGMVAKLMGVETVICGMDPMISMTMVEMGMDLGGVTTKLNLEDSLEFLRRRYASEEERPAR